MTTGQTRPLLRYHGAKWRIAGWIIAHFPPHRIYVEPFGGGGSVLLRKQPCYAEIYNDLDSEIVNLFRVVREDGATLARTVELTPYAREEHELSHQECAHPVEQARRTLTRSWFSYGSNFTRGSRDGPRHRSGFRSNRMRERGRSAAAEWTDMSGVIRETMNRFRLVTIENRDALKVMERYDGPQTLHYVDPPYHPATRNRKDDYRHELDEDGHRKLLECLLKLQGAVLLSGYWVPLYDQMLKGWSRIQCSARAEAGRARTEHLWMNPAATHFPNLKSQIQNPK